eukprot:tig00000158_g10171.t1
MGPLEMGAGLSFFRRLAETLSSLRFLDSMAPPLLAHHPLTLYLPLAPARRHAGATLGELQLGDNPLGNEGARYLAEGQAFPGGAEGGIAAFSSFLAPPPAPPSSFLLLLLLLRRRRRRLTRGGRAQNAVNVLKEAATNLARVREGRCGVRTDLGAFGGSGAAEGGSAGPGPGPVPSPRVELGPHPDTEAARRRAIKERDLDDLISTLSLGPAPAAY